MKKFACILLAAVMMLSCCPAVSAADIDSKAYDEAQYLNALGLFAGTDKGYELERGLTRIEAVIMAIRLFGKNNEAKYGEYEHPFIDAPTWTYANEYIGYAYQNKITYGVSETKFGPATPATAQMYVSFVLRALGYTNTYTNWKTLGQQAGIFPEDVDLENFTRADAVLISRAALDAKMADGSKTLNESLMENWVYNELQLAAASVKCGGKVSIDDSLIDIAGHIFCVDGVMEYLSGRGVNAVDEDTEDYFLGTDELNYTEAIAIEPMMTSNASSVVLARFASEEEAAAAVSVLLENASPYKWVCVGVSNDNVLAASIGNVAILVMDNQYADTFMVRFGILGELENAGTGNSGDSFVKLGAHYFEPGEEIKENALSNFVKKMNTISDKYLGGEGAVCAIIPDKSYFVADVYDEAYDHEAIVSAVESGLDGWDVIDLAAYLSLECYFRTDRHFEQTAIYPMVNAIGEHMDFYVEEWSFMPESIGQYVGCYGGEDIQSEEFFVATSEYTAEAVVTKYGEESTGVYIPEKFSNTEQLDVILGGASPIVTIEVPNAKRDKELVLFCDSFGAIVAPLLLEQYSKVTLVDLRFVNSMMLGSLVDFESVDVLFMYYDQIINNSFLLK